MPPDRQPLLLRPEPPLVAAHHGDRPRAPGPAGPAPGGLLLVVRPGALERGESGVDSGESLLDASRVVQGDAGGTQAGDAESHRDAMVAVAGDARRTALGR